MAGQADTVSAIIPFYGNPDDVAPLLASLARQSAAPHEIIVADDASPTPFPEQGNVTVVRQERNRGFGSTVNLGAGAASGDYLLVLNSDLTIHDTFIEDLLSHSAPWQPAVISPRLREHGRIAATARRWPSVRTTFFSWLTPLARFRDQPIWRRLAGHYDPTAHPLDGERVDWVVGACMLIPAAAFRTVGGFDERFHMNSEEVELQRRLTAQGVPSVIVPAVEVEHEGGGSSDPGHRRQWLVTGTFIYFAKTRKANRLRLALIGASLINLGWNALRKLRGAAVKPIVVFRRELQLIRIGYDSRMGTSREVPS